MRPAGRTVILATVLFVVSLVLPFFPNVQPLFLLLLSLVVFVVLLDAALLLLPLKVEFWREVPERFALLEKGKVGLTFLNHSRLPIRLRFYDGLPEEATSVDMPLFMARLKPGEYLKTEYGLTFQRRGRHTIENAHCEAYSLLGLWWKSGRLVGEDEVKVFPNYVPALNYGLLATADRAEMMGIVKPRNRGVSKEFHQLRDYHDGDALSQVDWKATARMRKLITREYQEERDQSILIVADCSMRTRALDDGLPLLEHLLNAAILISYIAVGQGDKVGVMSFGGEERFLPPVKGGHAMSTILNHLYDYQGSRSYGDYADLLSRISRLQTKRSLIILLTNLRSEDQFEAVEVLRELRQKHLVLLASVQENTVKNALNKELMTTEDAEAYLGALTYQQDIEALLKKAQGAGLDTIYESLDRFPIALANQFLDLRSSGRF